MEIVKLKFCSFVACLILVGCGAQRHQTSNEETEISATPSVTPFVLSPSGVGEMKLGAFTTWDTVPGGRVYYGSDEDGEFFAGERIMSWDVQCEYHDETINGYLADGTDAATLPVDRDGNRIYQERLSFCYRTHRTNFPRQPAVNLLEGPHKDFFTDENGGVLSVNYEIKVEREGCGVGGVKLYAPVTINAKTETIGETQVAGGLGNGDIPLNTKFVIQTNTPNIPNGKRQDVETLLGAIVNWYAECTNEQVKLNHALFRLKVYTVKIYGAR